MRKSFNTEITERRTQRAQRRAGSWLERPALHLGTKRVGKGKGPAGGLAGPFLFGGGRVFIRRRKGSRRPGRLRRCAGRVRGLWRRGRTRVRRRFSGPGREWRL